MIKLWNLYRSLIKKRIFKLQKGIAFGIIRFYENQIPSHYRVPKLIKFEKII